MAAFLHAHEPKHRLLYRVPNRQQPVVHEQRRLLGAEATRNIFALLLRQHHAIEALVQDVIVVESARILRDGVKGPAERTEGTAIDGV